VIKSFTHKGLKQFCQKSQAKGLSAEMRPRVRRVLDALDAAQSPDELNIPGFGLHPLKGDRKGTWAVRITGNWRITFRFEKTDVTDVDLEDYH